MKENVQEAELVNGTNQLLKSIATNYEGQLQQQSICEQQDKSEEANDTTHHQTELKLQELKEQLNAPL